MLNYVRRPMKTFLIIVSFALCTSARGQTIVFPDSSGPTTSGCGRAAIQPLLTSPPLHTDMPWKALLGYVWLDSAMRRGFTDSEWNALNLFTSADSLRQVLKYWYAAADYDPVLFNEYCSDGAYLNPNYWGKPALLVRYLADLSGKLLKDSSKVPYLMTTDYILHILVVNVTREVDPLISSNRNYPIPRGCAEVLILDTIKGKRFPFTNCNDTARRASGPGKAPFSLLNNCLHLSFYPTWSKDGSDQAAGFLVGRPGNADTLILTDKAFGWGTLQSGHEYIVFLKLLYEDYDGNNSYFRLRPIMDGVGGVYPVTAGVVSDPLNYWQLGTSVNSTAFKSGLRARINRILEP